MQTVAQCRRATQAGTTHYTINRSTQTIPQFTTTKAPEYALSVHFNKLRIYNMTV